MTRSRSARQHPVSNCFGVARQAFQFLACAMALLAMMVFAAPVEGKPLKSGPVVDVVQQKNGPSLRGVILSQEAGQPIQMAVSTKWLTEKSLVGKYRRENEVLQKESHQEAIDRLREVMKNPSLKPRETFFYRSELDRLEELIQQDSLPETEFLWCDLKADSIQRISAAPRDYRKIACLAWKEGLANVETREAVSLAKELESRGVKPETPCPDLTSQLPSRPQTAREWEGRLGILEYALAGAMDFQGTSDALVMVDEEKPIAWDVILSKMIKPKFDDVLGDLLGEKPKKSKTMTTEVLKVAMRAAEEAKRGSFRATMVDLDVVAARVTVQSRMMVRISGKWETVWRDQESLDGNVERPAEEKRIKSDPQVAKILEGVSALGVVSGSVTDKAIRMGAATMKAQQSVDGRFFQFRDSYTQRVTGPPITIDAE